MVPVLIKPLCDGTERPAHPVVRGKERNLVAWLEIKASQANKLESPGNGGVAAHCKQVMLARREASHSDAQSASRVLGVVARDRQRPGRIDLADGSVVHEVPSDGAVSTEKPTGIDQRLRAGN